MKQTLLRRAAVAALCAVLTACAGENANEKLADRITRAVAANDVAPIAADFNALVRPRLTHEAVGRLADELAPLGALKSVHETTPSGAPAGRHTFTVSFEHGTAQEDIELDEDGKVAGWHVHHIVAAR